MKQRFGLAAFDRNIAAANLCRTARSVQCQLQRLCTQQTFNLQRTAQLHILRFAIPANLQTSAEFQLFDAETAGLNLTMAAQGSAFHPALYRKLAGHLQFLHPQAAGHRGLPGDAETLAIHISGEFAFSGYLHLQKISAKR
ncbi:hypothetical protein D3C75_716400 [compost metagenome]